MTPIWEVGKESVEDQADATQELLAAHLTSTHAHNAANIEFNLPDNSVIPLGDKVEQGSELWENHLTSTHAHHGTEIVLGRGVGEVGLDEKIDQIESRLDNLEP